MWNPATVRTSIRWRPHCSIGRHVGGYNATSGDLRSPQQHVGLLFHDLNPLRDSTEYLSLATSHRVSLCRPVSLGQLSAGVFYYRQSRENSHDAYGSTASKFWNRLCDNLLGLECPQSMMSHDSLHSVHFYCKSSSEKGPHATPVSPSASAADA